MSSARGFHFETYAHYFIYSCSTLSRGEYTKLHIKKIARDKAKWSEEATQIINELVEDMEDVEREKKNAQIALDKAEKKNEIKLREKEKTLRELEKVNEEHAIQVASQFRLLTCARISENQLR